MIPLKDEKELQELIQQGKSVLIDFYADWCPPCRQLMPILEKISLAEKYSREIRFYKVNINEFPELAREYEITSIPTLIFLSGSEKPMEKHVGLFEHDNLVLLIEKYFF
ncbi:thioredoxin family protein [Candidatus Mycoplasma haematominutum]|uniref:Thioredoxin n=1 Tax=Candidatus Mycoplasma haematominutum 'Birmingham 1' TaxID=1116213 RepID=G8C3V7_9MOLU|nr:thioredoxin family protein [Candidatus Mycoplasma haematominutum]CCE67005.1 thioredoxin [Candidatus Mycoplasma haematominutum 'Birmingham 1']